MSARARAFARTALLAALALGGCADAPIVADTPRIVTGQRIAPWEKHEDCANAAEGDRIDFRFNTTEPVDFDLYYREGPAVIIPLSRKRVSADSGIFAVQIPARYCLAWQAGAAGTFVDYYITLHGRSR
jgi:hypothetical protein